MKPDFQYINKNDSKNTKTDVKLSTTSIIIGILVLIAATAPFWHIWFDKNSKEEFIGFVNIRRFLFAFGTHFAFFCCASFLFWVKNFIAPQFKNIIRVINIVGSVFIAISAYFLLWVFNPHSDFPKMVYEIAFTVAAVFIAYGMYLLNRFIVHTITESKHTIKNLIAFIFRVRNKHYKELAIKALYAEKNNKAKPTQETVSENVNEFEDDFYKTIEKIN